MCSAVFHQQDQVGADLPAHADTLGRRRGLDRPEETQLGLEGPLELPGLAVILDAGGWRVIVALGGDQNARSRKLKELQRRDDGLRREVRQEARAEVMAQPVYRAWQFLTGKGADIDTALRRGELLRRAVEDLCIAHASAPSGHVTVSLFPL